MACRRSRITSRITLISFDLVSLYQLSSAPTQLHWSTLTQKSFKPKSRLSFERTLHRHRKNGYKGVVPQAAGSSILQEQPLTFSIFQINPFPSHTVCGIGLTGHSPRGFNLQIAMIVNLQIAIASVHVLQLLVSFSMYSIYVSFGQSSSLLSTEDPHPGPRSTSTSTWTVHVGPGDDTTDLFFCRGAFALDLHGAASICA